MAATNGKLVTCDRCGKQIFLECTGEGETDGGYTRWNKFEPLPEEWKHNTAIGTLCPDCNCEYEKLLNNFKYKRNNFKNERE